MSPHDHTPLTLRCQFRATNWTETPYHELAGAGKLSRASITNSLSGDLEGEGVLEYLLAYPAAPGGDVPFIGYERIVGRRGEREGAFTLRHDGAYSPASGVNGRLEVVPDSGLGGFAGVRGSGVIQARPGEHGGEYVLNLELP